MANLSVENIPKNPINLFCIFIFCQFAYVNVFILKDR